MPPKDDPEFTDDDRLRAKVVLVRTVIQGTPRNLLSGIVGAFIMAFAVDHATGNSADRWVVWAWWIALSSGLAYGAWIAWRFHRQARSAGEVLATGRRLISNAICCSIGWGASSWLLLPAPNLQADAVLLIGTAMILVGGGGCQAIYRTYVRAFVVITVGMFALGLLRRGDEFHIVFGLAFVLLAFVVISFAQTQEETLRSTILLGFKTEKLLEEITLQQQATDLARHEAEAARRQAELANDGKNAFLAAAGHDLRQPMHALLQYFGSLQRRNRDAALTDTIDRIGKSLEAMQDLLDTILEVSKLMLGSVEPAFGTHKVSDILDRVDAQMRPLANDKGIALTIDPLSDCELETDDILLERILRNLVLNALRYTEAGRVHVRARRRGAKVVVQVFDTGIGIAGDQRARIFEAFYQVRNPGRDRHKGLGLGLAIVAQLGELLAAPVRVRSKVGKGSIFTVELSEARSRTSASRASAEAKPECDYLRGAFVVLIDDDADSLHASSASLTEFGCRVLAARSGTEAIERLRIQEFMPQIVVSDYRLDDGKTGLDAISTVIRDQQTRFGDEFAIPAIVMSGDTAPAELERVRQAGVTLLHKPVRLEVLYRAVNAQLKTLALDDRGFGYAAEIP